jgi:hypothetical protein
MHSHFDSIAWNESDNEFDQATQQELGAPQCTQEFRRLSINRFKELVQSVVTGEEDPFALFHQPYHFDWSENRVDLDSLLHLEWTVQHFLDYICLEGKSFCPLSTKNGRLFDTIHFTLKGWAMQYNNSRYYKSPFPTRKMATVKIAQSQRLTWYVTFHIDVRFGSQGLKLGLAIQPLPYHLFEQFLGLVVYVFETCPILCKYEFNSETFSINCYGKRSCDFGAVDWTIFQEHLFKNWTFYFQAQGTWNDCWKNIIPVMHALDFGGNTPIVLQQTTSETTEYLIESMSNQFDPSYLHRCTFAIATEVTVVQTIDGEDISIALLANASKVRSQFMGSEKSNGLRIFPQCFSQNACSFQSKTIPGFYNKAVSGILSQLECDNRNGSGTILSVESFQGYSLLKHQIRHSAGTASLGHSIITAGLCTNESFLKHNQKPQLYELQKACSIYAPFQKFSQGLEVCAANGHTGIRFEPVFCIEFSNLAPENRTIDYFVRQAMVPFIEVWTTKGIAMSKAVIDGYFHDVSCYSRNVLL